MTQTKPILGKRSPTEVKQQEESQLDDLYRHVQEKGHLRTRDHARRWSRAVLNVLGLNLDRSTRRKLAGALPPQLAQALTGVFRLLDFRDPTLTSLYFQRQVALRAGHSDAQFAALPVKAVFHYLKQMIGQDLSDRVAQTLSPEIQELWQEA
jgi:uncharacterized protein (DUF2267 family)